MPDFAAAEYITPDIHIADNRLSLSASNDHSPIYPHLHSHFAYNPRTWKTMYIALKNTITRRRDTSTNKTEWEIGKPTDEVPDPFRFSSGNAPWEYGSRVHSDIVETNVTTKMKKLIVNTDVFERTVFLAYDTDFFSEPPEDLEFPEGYPHGQFLGVRHDCGSIENQRERLYTPSFYYDQQEKQGLEERTMIARIMSE